MKNPLYITRGYQFRYMLGRHLIALVICSVFQIFGVLGFFQFNIMRIILGITFAGVHLYVLYKGALELGKGDLKAYTPLKYEMKWPMLWGGMISGVAIILIAVYLLNWKFFSVNGVMTGNGSVIVNLLFYIAEAPYMAFFYGAKVPGTLPWYVILLMVGLPVLASFSGYYLARNEDKVTEKINKIVFENEEDEE